MTYFAIQEALDGKMVEWMEKVSDEQYRKVTRNALADSSFVNKCVLVTDAGTFQHPLVGQRAKDL